jgi:Uma2 family endonuclease
MTALFDQLLEAPDIKLLIEKLEHELSQESEQRKAFYDWVREDQKAEFINGEIILNSPVKRAHWVAVCLLENVLNNYVLLNDLGEVATEKAMVSLTRNDYEPDICFWKKSKSDAFTEDMMLHPAPDLVVEVLSKGTAKKDRGIKFTDYAAHGIAEYWLIDAQKREVEQFVLTTDNDYVLLAKGKSDAVIQSQVVVGFEIKVAAIFDKKENMQALRKIFKSN